MELLVHDGGHSLKTSLLKRGRNYRMPIAVTHRSILVCKAQEGFPKNSPSELRSQRWEGLRAKGRLGNTTSAK